MLRSEKLAVTASLEAKRLEIKEKDLSNLTNFLDGLSTQSALFAGFAFVSFAELPEGTSEFLAFMLHLSTSVSLGANLFVVCVGQLATILGPTLALNGPKGAMERAVDHMREYRKYVFGMFILGLLGFFLMVEFLIFIYVKTWIAIISACIMGVFFVITIRICSQQLSSFSFVAPKLSYIAEISINNAGGVMGDKEDTGGEAAASESVAVAERSDSLIPAAKFLENASGEAVTDPADEQ